MFDMAGLTSSSQAQLLTSSPAASLIKMSSSPFLLSPAMSMSPNTTPNHNNHHHLQQQQHHHQQHHQLNNLLIKKEVGLLSSSCTANNENELLNSLTSSDGPAEVFNSKCKRKINFSHLGIPQRGHQPATVARRNARERNRVKQVNNGFAALKQHIPLGHRSKKMSKVETLKCAVDYIKNLKTLLNPADVLGDVFDHQHFQFDFGVSDGSGSAQQMSPTSSDDPSSPSYASEGSYVASSAAPTALYEYENYDPVSPEDEELLDQISWWQQS